MEQTSAQTFVNIQQTTPAAGSVGWALHVQEHTPATRDRPAALECWTKRIFLADRLHKRQLTLPALLEHTQQLPSAEHAGMMLHWVSDLSLAKKV